MLMQLCAYSGLPESGPWTTLLPLQHHYLSHLTLGHLLRRRPLSASSASGHHRLVVCTAFLKITAC